MEPNPQQLCETARHYGNLRFVMFSVFTTLNGAVILFGFSKDTCLPHDYLVWILRAVGVSLALCFLAGDYRLATLTHFYQKQSAKWVPLPPSSSWWEWLSKVIMASPYLLILIVWIASCWFPELARQACTGSP